MSIISLNFFILFLIVVLVYYLLPESHQWVWLFVVSLFFYYKNSTLSQCILFIFFLMVNFAGSVLIGKDPDNSKKKYILVLLFDIVFLAAFKYSDFFYQIIVSIANLFNSNLPVYKLGRVVELLNYFAPPRISYFALIVIGYITDVYWQKVDVQKNICKFFLFASFFPQMTSGPIVLYSQMESQLWGKKHRFSYDTFIFGIERILWGIFKKIVISERCAVVVNQIYSSYEVYPGFYILFAAAMFSLQLYCDFSGLMDIVLGLAQCFGITLPENFETPFYSRNLSEFWRRWHITLGGFLRDYVLYPVQRSSVFKKLRKFSKNKFGKGYEKKFNLPLYLSLLVSWFLIGLWHGGGWNYIFGVGLYMWVIIVLSDILKNVFAKITQVLKINTECASYRLFQRVRTFLIFIFGLSFFRAESLKAGFGMWKNGFSSFNPWIFFDKSLLNLGLSASEWNILILGVIMLFVVSLLSQRDSVRAILKRQNFFFSVAVFAVLFIMIICWGYYGMDFNAADFIYGRF